MIETTLARRYSKALFSLAKEAGSEDRVHGELEELEKLMATHPALHDILSNRFLDLQARMKVVDEVAQKMGLAREVVSFFKLLIKKGRLPFFGLIAQFYKKLTLASQNKIEAEVTSASPLSETIYGELKKIFSEKSGKEVLIHPHVDPSVLAGIRVSLGNVAYDGTAKAELDRLTEKMRRGAMN